MAAKIAVSSTLHCPASRRVRVASRCSHNVTAGRREVGAWDAQMPASGQLDEHGTHIAGVVFDPAALRSLLSSSGANVPSK